MRSFYIKILFPLLATVSFQCDSRAEPLRDFLVASAYGTAAGALIGVASLAFTEDPGSKLNNIARGASLGLYAGMGLGLYLGSAADSSQVIKSGFVERNKFWVQGTWRQDRSQLDGLSLQTMFASF